MCTVSYTFNGQGIYFTSSRDENIKRLTIPPQAYKLNYQTVIYPKDSQSGGTWIAASKNRIMCLLNGEQTQAIDHEIKTSRGIVVLKSLFCTSYDELKRFVLDHEVDPFILIQLDFTTEIYLKEIVWNGRDISQKRLNPNDSHLWVSSSLYTKEISNKRQRQFSEWLDENPRKFPVEFHSKLKSVNDNFQKNKDIKTVSISNIHLKNESLTFSYDDLLCGNSQSLSLVLEAEKSESPF